MYSETRHKQGVAAKEAWNKVDLAGQLTAARRQEADLLAEQLATEDALKRAARDATALELALGEPLKIALLPKITGDLDTLAGEAWDDIAALQSAGDAAARPAKVRVDIVLDALDDIVFSEKSLTTSRNEFARFALEMPSCAQIQAGTADASINESIAAHPHGEGALIDAAWSAAKSECVSLAQANGSVTLFLGGALKQSVDRIDQAVRELDSIRATSLHQRNSYRAAAKSLDTALKEWDEDPHAAREKIDAALDRLQGLAAVLQALPDAFSSKFVSEARIKSLNDLLASVQTAGAAGKVPADASTAVKVLAQFPDLFDRARVALADAQKPRLAPLVLLKNLEKVKADTAARDVDSQLAKMQLLRDKYKWELQRLRSTRDAFDFLTNHCDDCLGWTVSEAMQPVEAKQAAGKAGAKLVQAKANVLKSAALYLDARGRLAASASKVQYQINALDRERALAYAEGNIAQWNTLITSVVDQMSDFGDIGIKHEDIARALNSAALLLIGIGVN